MEILLFNPSNNSELNDIGEFYSKYPPIEGVLKLGRYHTLESDKVRKVFGQVMMCWSLVMQPLVFSGTLY